MTDTTDDADAVGLDWRGPLPPGFARRIVTIPPDLALAFEPVAWVDAIVTVEHGELEVEGVSGNRYFHTTGDVVAFSGLPLRALRAVGPDAVVLVAVARTNTATFQPRPMSRASRARHTERTADAVSTIATRSTPSPHTQDVHTPCSPQHRPQTSPPPPLPL
jgi:hypothetical protein